MRYKKPLTIVECAELTGLHRNTLRLWTKKGILPDRRRPGMRKHLIYESDLLKIGVLKPEVTK